MILHAGMSADPAWVGQRPDWVRVPPGWVDPPACPPGVVRLQVQPIPAGADGRLLDVVSMPAPLRVSLWDTASNRPIGHWHGNADASVIDRCEPVWMPPFTIPAVTIAATLSKEQTGTRWEPRRTLDLHRGEDPYPHLTVELRIWGQDGWYGLTLEPGQRRRLVVRGDIPVEHLALRQCERQFGRHMQGACPRTLDGRMIPAAA